jgi:hypothetical protein
MPDPAESVLEWRLLGTFKELISWQRRTDNQLESDQFVDEHTTTTATVALDPNVPPAPPAPNMTTLSHKSALFNWMRWLDVGATVRTLLHYVIWIRTHRSVVDTRAHRSSSNCTRARAGSPRCHASQTRARERSRERGGCAGRRDPEFRCPERRYPELGCPRARIISPHRVQYTQAQTRCRGERRG